MAGALRIKGCPWLIAAGIIVLIVAFSSLAAYGRPSVDHTKKDDIRKLYGG
jgi:hypothetical protein